MHKVIIKPLVTFKEGWMTERFVFGGTKKSGFADKKYVYQITSYLNDTGEKVILIDTSFPEFINQLPPEMNLGVCIGKRSQTFEEALNQVGYKKEDVDQIILTHNNLDHAGMITLFPNADILVSKKDYNGLVDKDNLNVVAVDLEKNHYKNFNGAYQVVDKIYFVKAYGHTEGHGIVLAYDEKDDLHYMFSGDVTVTNEALYNNEILLVNDNVPESIKTLNSIREFIRNHKTVYLSSHDPESVNHLEEKIAISLGEE